MNKFALFSLIYFISGTSLLGQSIRVKKEFKLTSDTVIPYVQTFEYQYDTLGNLKREVTFNAHSKSDIKCDNDTNNVRIFFYDTLNIILEELYDCKNIKRYINKYSYQYDCKNRLTSKYLEIYSSPKQLVESYKYKYKYTRNDSIKSITTINKWHSMSKKRRVWSKCYKYDKIGRTIKVGQSIFRPLKIYSFIEYDSLNRITRNYSKISKHENQYFYDIYGQLIEKRLLSKNKDIYYSYTWVNGELTEEKCRTDYINSDSTTAYEKYEYDSYGNIIKIIGYGIGHQSKKIEYTYY